MAHLKQSIVTSQEIFGFQEDGRTPQQSLGGWRLVRMNPLIVILHSLGSEHLICSIYFNLTWHHYEGNYLEEHNSWPCYQWGLPQLFPWKILRLANGWKTSISVLLRDLQWEGAKELCVTTSSVQKTGSTASEGLNVIDTVYEYHLYILISLQDEFLICNTGWVMPSFGGRYSFFRRTCWLVGSWSWKSVWSSTTADISFVYTYSF